MYLKALEIIGFKSFSEKVELKFSEGITAIVGPNGCGKSNLVDAIRWALGEQRARLMRGAKMEELLFSGTVKRKALNFAEVSLIFDDADKLLPLDYHEIKVTRRMYRSGDGEYFLNNTACRLRDILELFWDTGIGTDTYSFIGQGRVEQIINLRPDERRELFEEAAEIHKYKEKKRETANRLAEMKGNMLRVEDLLAELRGRWGDLSGAAELAKEYRELQSQLLERERKLFELRWEKNRSAAEKIESELARLEELVRDKRANLQGLSDDVAELVRDEAQIFLDVEEKQKGFQMLKSGVEDLRHESSIVREQRKFAKERSVLKEEAYQEVQSRLEGIEGTLLQNKADLENVQKEQEIIGEKAGSLQEEVKVLRSGSRHASQEKLKAQLAEFRSREAALEQSVKDNESRRRELEERVSALEGKREARWLEAENWRKEDEAAGAALARLQNEQRDLDEERQLRQKHYHDFSSRCAQQKDEYGRSVQELEKKAGRLRLLQENEDELTAYAGGVKAVMQTPSLKGIFGPVAGLINVSQDFEKAIEIALGASLQFIVVEDDRAAREAIGHLKAKKAGRATFLPLNMLKIPSRKEIPQTQEGLLHLASKVVETKEEYKKAVDYLLGGILIAKDLDTALQVARNDKGGWRIVTLDGEMITPGGAISGGFQPKERSGLLQRRRELAELQKEIEVSRERLEEQKNKLQEEDAKLESLQQDLNALVLKHEAFEKEKNENSSRLEKCRLERERSSKEIGELDKEKADLNVRNSLLQSEREKIASELNTGKESMEKLEQELKQTEEQVSREEDTLKQLEEELMEIRVKFSALQEKESSFQEMIRRQAQEKEDLLTLAGTLSQEQIRAVAEIDRLAEKEADLTGRLEQAKDELESAEENLQELTRGLSLCRRRKEELEAEKEKEHRSLERYERRSYQLNLEKTQLREEKRYLREHHLEKYGIDPDTASHFQIDESEEELQKEKERLSAQILDLGDVNSGAIEEYERLQERIDFLETQLKDLLLGEKGMQKVLAELDKEMEKRFLQALHTIEKFFLDSFTGLFGGGQAFIKLTDPENVLESGIEIIAQPPGKKLQNITLLSGGEKALTSIALLFAVLQYKPVPFCVLDEIDSSLDESNIERFIGFLKQYSSNSQFIMITHRQKTMEEADVLYGVTMEEQGISKVLSINLSKKAG